jgi:hypothetical protein
LVPILKAVTWVLLTRKIQDGALDAALYALAAEIEKMVESLLRLPSLREATPCQPI